MADGSINLTDVAEIIVKYKNGKNIIYRGKGIESFISQIEEYINPSADDVSDQTYASMNLTYKASKMSPHELARAMQKEAESAGAKF